MPVDSPANVVSPSASQKSDTRPFRSQSSPPSARRRGAGTRQPGRPGGSVDSSVMYQGSPPSTTPRAAASVKQGGAAVRPGSLRSSQHRGVTSRGGSLASPAPSPAPRGGLASALPTATLGRLRPAAPPFARRVLGHQLPEQAALNCGHRPADSSRLSRRESRVRTVEVADFRRLGARRLHTRESRRRDRPPVKQSSAARRPSLSSPEPRAVNTASAAPHAPTGLIEWVVSSTTPTSR